jgi:type IV pilus assembly protein PilV
VEEPVFQNSQGLLIDNLCFEERGFTLIEVMIAMFVLLVGMLALLNTSAVVIENNLANVLRDEAATLAQSKMSDIKNTPFSDINSEYLLSQPPQPTVLPICGLPASPLVVTRSFRDMAVNYNVACNLQTLDSAGDTISVQVIVSWSYKGNLYSHTVATVMSNP